MTKKPKLTFVCDRCHRVKPLKQISSKTNFFGVAQCKQCEKGGKW